ncbi:hypothetical protein IU451_29225 [Nocardia cyriacigeorgica]|uniref:hypothetical protein n=1 Tax=Nocardia cyriacigeorgica TaxID=135487 RepID=UPI0018930364|nr:hypothetical protein [Nocardia cyriacigeorgica]MBF6326583.1 hypothetical protein [Nocardia cyriacigeorgica]
MHYYQYLHDPAWVIASEEPRPDLLAWAYWSEVDGPAKAKPAPVSEPEPDRLVEPEVAAEPDEPADEQESVVVDLEPEAKPAAKKSAPRKAPAKKVGE